MRDLPGLEVKSNLRAAGSERTSFTPQPLVSEDDAEDLHGGRAIERVQTGQYL